MTKNHIPTGDHAWAMTLMIVAMLMLPGMDAIAKWLSGTISAGQVTWSRFFFQTVLMSPLLLTTHGEWLNNKLFLHAARGVLIGGATLLFFSGLAYLPIAEAISIFFIEPLLVTILSAVLLGESVGWRRLSAIFVGFIGALIIIRPTFAEIGLPTLYPVGAACCFSFYIILTRKLVATEDPIRLQFFAGMFGLGIMSLALFIGADNDYAMLKVVSPSLFQWGLLAILGVIATLAHLLVTYAYRRAPVSILAPFQYVEIIGATLLGLMLFDDFPDGVTWLGVAVVVGSGIYVFHRESKLA